MFRRESKIISDREGMMNRACVLVIKLYCIDVFSEAQAAHDSHEQGRLVYRYGGDVVGEWND